MFRCLTENAFAKALATETLQQYSYLQIDQHICNAHYMEIVENVWTTLVLEPNNFKKKLEESNSDLISFFDEMCKIIILLNWSLNLQEDAKKKVVVILYLIAGLHNMQANQFKLKLGLYLVACEASCETINTLSNARISVTNKTVYNNRKKLLHNTY
ncbi:hypothetical protein F8M41_000239 [Gigaspora margarita]|uniref:Uncharacterized protein n=1 Tax=Gigaspora margarita TaxID=4874 RepID=A0A8H4AA11_GIGMA|nr:hypothetical protein F8M41_000239 [Gigaspora margarita]